MEFEDEWEDTLVCPACGHSVDLEHYGMENDEEYDALYPTRDQICDDLIRLLAKGKESDEGSFSFLFIGDGYAIPL